ncbi:unnamed protein product, partial [Ixodes persulcatus]
RRARQHEGDRRVHTAIRRRQTTTTDRSRSSLSRLHKDSDQLPAIHASRDKTRAKSNTRLPRRGSVSFRRDSTLFFSSPECVPNGEAESKPAYCQRGRAAVCSAGGAGESSRDEVVVTLERRPASHC